MHTYKYLLIYVLLVGNVVQRRNVSCEYELLAYISKHIQIYSNVYEYMYNKDNH